MRFRLVDPGCRPKSVAPAARAGDERDARAEACEPLDRLAGSVTRLCRIIEAMLATAPPSRRPFRLVHVACGRGELTAALAERLGDRLVAARPTGAVCELLGIDADRRAIEAAQAGVADRPVMFAMRSVQTEGCPPCDFAFGSQLLQRFTDPEAEAVLRSIAEATRLGAAFSELIRSPAGLAFGWLGPRLSFESRAVISQAAAAVRGSRTLAEYRTLADRAGLPHATIRRVWPERALLAWKTTEPLPDLLPGVACA